MSVVAPVPWADSAREPRRWQREALDAVLAEVRSGGRPLVSACTGAGKSVLIAEVVRLAAEAARPTGDVVVVATPTQALVRQLAETLRQRLGAAAVGEYYGARKQPTRAVVVACNPSLESLVVDLAAAGRRVRLLLIDEAHREAAPNVRATLPALAPRVIVGVTATPFRADDRSLESFSRCVYRYTITDAVRDGVLVPYVPRWAVEEWGIPAEDQDSVCVEMIRRYADGPGIASATSIVDADAFAARLTADGISALSIHSQLGRRESDSRIARLLAGELRCLVHVALLVEGVDIPPLRWLCLRRPTGSPVRLVQEIGRVLRTCPGKTSATVMDPHEALRTVGMDHPEAIGMGAELDAILDTATASEEGSGGPAPRLPPPPVVFVSELRQWARRSVLAMQAAGMGRADARPHEAREGWASPRMVAQVQHLAGACRWVPADLRPAVEQAIGRGDDLTAGEARDLVDLLGGLMIWKERAAAVLEPAPARAA